jgi:hypothetical protein
VQVALAEISRVLAPGGVFVATTFLTATAPLGQVLGDDAVRPLGQVWRGRAGAGGGYGIGSAGWGAPPPGRGDSSPGCGSCAFGRVSPSLPTHPRGGGVGWGGGFPERGARDRVWVGNLAIGGFDGGGAEAR